MENRWELKVGANADLGEEVDRLHRAAGRAAVVLVEVGLSSLDISREIEESSLIVWCA
jgi:hypothetical protein